MPSRESHWDYMLRRMREEDEMENKTKMDPFMNRFVSDSHTTREELGKNKHETLDEVQQRYLFSAERHMGMSFEEYVEDMEFSVDEERVLAEELGIKRKELTLNDLLEEALKEQEEDMSLGAQQANEMAAAWREPAHEELTFGPINIAPLEEQFYDDQAEDEIQMAVDPGHYKGVAGGKQYIELMAEILESHVGVESHLLGQSYKYMMRLGKKDAPEQDAKKAAFYLMCLVQYLRDGDISADKVQKALKEL